MQTHLETTKPSMPVKVEAVSLNGSSLTIQQVVDVALGKRRAQLVTGEEGRRLREEMADSVHFLASKLDTSIYGMSTGFGGSADTRTQALDDLQIAIVEHQLCGVLPLDSDRPAYVPAKGVDGALPIDIVRGSILIRVNSLIRAHSAIRVEVIESLLALIEHGITPVVPLRGSISASGDLSPLSYIAAAICAHPSSRVTVPSLSAPGMLEVLPATVALRKFGLPTIKLGPKEGLALCNGTSVSASAACLALNRALHLLEVAQLGTAMTLEALIGHVGSFDPFIHDVTRPHPGQIAVAKHMRDLLADSKFAVHIEHEVKSHEDDGLLRQDRYPLRTSAQWLGPVVTDFESAKQVLEIEINSTTDNPLVDHKSRKTHHGGNFQAMAPALAMEKVRLGLALIGKLAFTQTTEMLNAQMNRGLPSCLAGDEPSTNYHAKGLDIHIAAYCAELGYLANPMTSHVQSAEMHNQAVNSMALASARKTHESCDVLLLLLATQLYCGSQALDLRYQDDIFRQALRDQIIPTKLKALKLYTPALARSVYNGMYRRLDATNSMDLDARMMDVWRSIESQIVDAGKGKIQLNDLVDWRVDGAKQSAKVYRSVRDAFTKNSCQDVAERLGRGTKHVYQYIRGDLGVDFRRGDIHSGGWGESVGMNVSKIARKLSQIDGSFSGQNTLSSSFDLSKNLTSWQRAKL